MFPMSRALDLGLGPVLVPISVGVYAAFVLLLLHARYGAACSLLGVAIYGASTYSCIHAKLPTGPCDGLRASVLDPFTALARTRVGIFVLINVVAIVSVLYVGFMQHALRRRFPGSNELLLVPPQPAVEAILFSSRAGLYLLVNVGYSLLYSCFCALHAHVFEGRLRAAERDSVSELLAKLLPAKVVLLAVLDPDLNEMVMWLSWFSLLGFLRVLARLVRLRLADIASRPEGRRRVGRLAAFAHVLVGCALFWFGVAVVFCCSASRGGHALLLLTSECALLALDALACIGHRRAMRGVEWEAGRERRHRIDLAHGTMTGVLAIGQHAHTWFLHGLAHPGMLDVFLLASVYAEAELLVQRCREHAAFCARTRELQRCPLASAAELSHFDDHCSICLETLLLPGAPAADCPARTSWAQNSSNPRRLAACGHIFHSLCLCAWLEQGHRTCPTCRAPTSASAAADEGSGRPRRLEEQPDSLRSLRTRPPSALALDASGGGASGLGWRPAELVAEAALSADVCATACSPDTTGSAGRAGGAGGAGVGPMVRTRPAGARRLSA